MAINLRGKRISFPDRHYGVALPVLSRATRNARPGLDHEVHSSNDSVKATNSETNISDKRRCHLVTSSGLTAKA